MIFFLFLFFNKIIIIWKYICWIWYYFGNFKKSIYWGSSIILVGCVESILRDLEVILKWLVVVWILFKLFCKIEIFLLICFFIWCSCFMFSLLIFFIIVVGVVIVSIGLVFVLIFVFFLEIMRNFFVFYFCIYLYFV